MFDGGEFGRQMAAEVKTAIAPLFAKIAFMEARILELQAIQGPPGEKGEPGIPGKDAEITAPILEKINLLETKALVQEKSEEFWIELLKSDQLKGPQGERGDKGDKGDIAEVYVDPIELSNLVIAEVAKIPKPENGKDVDPTIVDDLIKTKLKQAIADIPKAIDGKDGKDGIGVVNAVIDREGILVLTFSDGSLKALGTVTGTDADPQETSRMIAEELTKLPKPKDGKDGFGFDDLKVVHDGERKFTLQFQRGEQIKEFAFDLAILLDRGVWREGKYQKGDTVSWSGSGWIAQCDTTEKPEQGSKDWRLAIKRGRDGKDGNPGPRGDKGDSGHDGKDLTQLGHDGKKW
jgi:hypothetical protein